MAAFDVDGDGRVDLLAGIYWFKHQGGNEFQPIQIADHPGRIAAGHFKPGKVAQIVLGPGDGNGPLWFIECQGDPTDPKAWMRRPLLDRDVLSGHTLAVADINADGNLDIFCAEMHTPGAEREMHRLGPVRRWPRDNSRSSNCRSASATTSPAWPTSTATAGWTSSPSPTPGTRRAWMYG